ncbi:hypothetical protein [Pararhizobium gei]|uniref:hypothetical protein n=1 Tax=Pararhizobium gei TaxID=1395951 RepID=UPI0023DC21BE|nr:hypothetical protein [Rhizobium gei]
MAASALGLFFEDDYRRVYILPFGITLASLFVALAFIPKFLDDYLGALFSIIFSIICEIFIISVFVYASGIHIGMLNVVRGSAGETVIVFASIYTVTLVFVYFVSQLAENKIIK